ncbi:hypothetical protein SLE2022_399490 [Rubroshorea leprosula]
MSIPRCSCWGLFFCKDSKSYVDSYVCEHGRTNDAVHTPPAYILSRFIADSTVCHLVAADFYTVSAFLQVPESLNLWCKRVYMLGFQDTPKVDNQLKLPLGHDESRAFHCLIITTQPTRQKKNV